MTTYLTPPEDPLAARTRRRLRAAGRPRDVDGVGRLAVHLSDWEYDQLIELNPETLGHDDPVLAKLYWRDFVTSPACACFRVNERV